MTGRQQGKLTPDEEARVGTLQREKFGSVRIGKALGRPTYTIERFLKKYRSTVSVARLQFEAHAEQIALQTIKDARGDAVAGLEIMGRLDVLPKKREDVQKPGAFNIIIGMPGAPVPVPRELSGAVVVKTPDEDDG